MTPAPSLCSCFRWCAQCPDRQRRKRSGRLIPRRRYKTAGGGGGCTSRDEGDNSEYEEEENEEEEEESESERVMKRYSAFDSPLFRRPGVDLDLEMGKQFTTLYHLYLFIPVSHFIPFYHLYQFTTLYTIQCKALLSTFHTVV